MASATMEKKRTPRRPRAMVIGLRGTDEWKQWIDEYALYRRMTIADLVDRALEEDAKRSGFRVPPMR